MMQSFSETKMFENETTRNIETNAKVNSQYYKIEEAFGHVWTSDRNILLQ